MRLITFNFTKLDLEKKLDDFKDLKISTGIDLLDIREISPQNSKNKELFLLIKFDHTINYEKDIALLKLLGNLIISIDSSQAQEILDKWKEKKLPESFRLGIFNIIFKKSSLKALQFEEELGLPSHIPFPSFKQPNKKK